MRSIGHGITPGFYPGCLAEPQQAGSKTDEASNQTDEALARAQTDDPSRSTAAWAEQQALGQRNRAQLLQGRADEQPRLQGGEQRDELCTLGLAECAGPPVRLARKRDQPLSLRRVKPPEMLGRKPGKLRGREHRSKPSAFSDCFEGQAGHGCNLPGQSIATRAVRSCWEAAPNYFKGTTFAH